MPLLTKSLAEIVLSFLKSKGVAPNLNDAEFEKFIEQTEKLMTAEERYFKSTEKELDEFCDDYFSNDTEVEKYCKDKHIPTE